MGTVPIQDSVQFEFIDRGPSENLLALVAFLFTEYPEDVELRTVVSPTDARSIRLEVFAHTSHTGKDPLLAGFHFDASSEDGFGSIEPASFQVIDEMGFYLPRTVPVPCGVRHVEDDAVSCGVVHDVIELGHSTHPRLS